MTRWMRLAGVVVQLELRQRVRSVAWYVLLGVVGLITGAVILVLYGGLSSSPTEVGGVIFSAVLFLVLLVATLVTPALCGAAINGEREAGTLAATQLTQISSSQLVLGKVVATWIASLGFLVVTLPFLLASVVLGGLRPEAVAIGLVILIVEIGVVSAIGVGLSGLIRGPVFSLVTTYLVVAALGVGTPIAFGIGTLVVQETRTIAYPEWTYSEDGSSSCELGPETEVTQSRPDLVWGLLAANPYVVMADAIPPSFGQYGTPNDAFSAVALTVRQVQQPPTWPSCGVDRLGAYDPQDVYDDGVPSWFVGLGIHLVIAGSLVGGAIASTRAPSRRLAPGSRIA